jgi:hypothetical protein
MREDLFFTTDSWKGIQNENNKTEKMYSKLTPLDSALTIGVGVYL